MGLNPLRLDDDMFWWGLTMDWEDPYLSASAQRTCIRFTEL
jgi:hypothetical protein